MRAFGAPRVDIIWRAPLEAIGVKMFLSPTADDISLVRTETGARVTFRPMGTVEDVVRQLEVHIEQLFPERAAIERQRDLEIHEVVL